MPYPSSFPPIPLPEGVDLWALLFERPLKPFPSTKPIFTDHATSRTHTYDSVRRAARSFGAGLKARWRWRKGDVLALFTPNSVDTAVVTMGVLWAGGVVSPANPTYTATELARQLSDSGARALATQAAYLDTAREAARIAGMSERRILLLGDERDATTADSRRARHYVSLRGTSYTGRYARARVDPAKDLAFLVYSSGTTGLPKGVCLTHGNMVANLLQFAHMDGRTFFPTGGTRGEGDKQLGILPLFHIYVSLSLISSFIQVEPGTWLTRQSRA